MRASLPFRLILLAAAGAIGWAAPAPVALLCAAPVLLLYVLVGEAQMLRRYVRPMAALLLVSALLWFLVKLDFDTLDWRSAASALVEPGAPFALVVRIAIASLLAVLAIGAAPDGHALPLAKSFRLSDTAAILYAGARALVGTIRESFERSIVALRAHGVLSDRRRNLIRHLPRILGLTWTSCLDLTMGRAEVKWERNGFLIPGAAVFQLRSRARLLDNLFCLATAAAIAGILVRSGGWR